MPILERGATFPVASDVRELAAPCSAIDARHAGGHDASDRLLGNASARAGARRVWRAVEASGVESDRCAVEAGRMMDARLRSVRSRGLCLRSAVSNDGPRRRLQLARLLADSGVLSSPTALRAERAKDSTPASSAVGRRHRPAEPQRSLGVRERRASRVRWRGLGPQLA